MTIQVIKDAAIANIETASIVNIETFTECDFIQTFLYETNDLEDPVPIELAGYSLRMMVRENGASATALIDCSTANGRIIIDYDNIGQFILRIPFPELTVLTPGIYVHSLVAQYQDMSFNDTPGVGVGEALGGVTVGTLPSGVDTPVAFGNAAIPAIIRKQIWRGTLTHAAGPTR